MRRSALFLICVLIAATASTAAQVAESANVRRFSLTAGGFGSVFDPDNGANRILYFDPQGNIGTNRLIGPGVYLDAHFTHWFQLEAEARWLRFNQFAGEHQDNYLIGPKVPIHQFGHANLYGKAMIGVGKITLPTNAQLTGHGTLIQFAYGGGVDYKLTPKLSVRAIDFEFQQWPFFLPTTALYPYGISVGLGYKIF